MVGIAKDAAKSPVFMKMYSGNAKLISRAIFQSTLRKRTKETNVQIIIMNKKFFVMYWSTRIENAKFLYFKVLLTLKKPLSSWMPDTL